MCDSSIKVCKSQGKIGYTETIFAFSYNLLKIILAISKTSMILCLQEVADSTSLGKPNNIP